jgi:hypothetical protein
MVSAEPGPLKRVQSFRSTFRSSCRAAGRGEGGGGGACIMRLVIRISFRIQQQWNPLGRRLSTIDDK